jgi:hypothetical protein
MWPVFVAPAFLSFGGATVGAAVASGEDLLGVYTLSAPETSLDGGVRFYGNEVWLGARSSGLRVPVTGADGAERYAWLTPLALETGVGTDLWFGQGGVYVGVAPRAVTAGGYLRLTPVAFEDGWLGVELRGYGTARPSDGTEVQGISLNLRWELRAPLEGAGRGRPGRWPVPPDEAPPPPTTENPETCDEGEGAPGTAHHGEPADDPGGPGSASETNPSGAADPPASDGPATREPTHHEEPADAPTDGSRP